MDQSLGALFSEEICMDNGPESSSKVSPRLALVHGWLFPDTSRTQRSLFERRRSRHVFITSATFFTWESRAESSSSSSSLVWLSDMSSELHQGSASFAIINSLNSCLLPQSSLFHHVSDFIHLSTFSLVCFDVC